MEIYSENLLADVKVDTEIFSESAEEILSSLIGPEGEGSVVFVSDERIRELNAAYRNIDRATDVLSFSCAEDEMNRGVVGDVYISLETAGRQAEERGVALEEELLRLMIHGLLHLVGHTHDGEEDGNAMRALEEDLFGRQAPRVLGGAGRGESEEKGTAERDRKE